jgi:hypothetical protein
MPRSTAVRRPIFSGSGYFQETHPEPLFKECSHYCELISGVKEMPRTLEIAIREAIGKRGVSVHLGRGNLRGNGEHGHARSVTIKEAPHDASLRECGQPASSVTDLHNYPQQLTRVSTRPLRK